MTTRVGAILAAIDNMQVTAEEHGITIDGITMSKDDIQLVASELSHRGPVCMPVFAGPGPLGGRVGTLCGVPLSQAPDLETKAGLIAQIQALAIKLERFK